MDEIQEYDVVFHDPISGQEVTEYFRFPEEGFLRTLEDRASVLSEHWGCEDIKVTWREPSSRVKVDLVIKNVGAI